VRRPVEELVDLARVGPGTRPPTPAELRAALPRGWVLEPDLRTARRDARILFREGWILALALVCFGAAGAGLFWFGLPRDPAALARFAAVAIALALLGGVVAPLVTRALHRR
jgi:hypothetical protein